MLQDPKCDMKYREESNENIYIVCGHDIKN